MDASTLLCLGVPTVIIDSGLESDAIVSYVATDNTKGGELAADRAEARLREVSGDE